MTKQLLAPNRKPSNLNAEQYELVRTVEFKKWFGDWEKLALTKFYDSGIDEVSLSKLENSVSKVIDENGEPFVVYHGTYVENLFYVFDFTKADLGFHFGTYEQAKNRSETKPFFANKKSNISPFFLNIKTLLSASDITEWEYPQRYIDMLIGDNIITEKEAKENKFYQAYYREDNKVIREFIMSKYGNYVGFYYNNKYEGEGLSYIVLNESQIKLADGTNTTFDYANDDIRFYYGGMIEDLINKGIVELKFYETTSEHAREYGLISKKPIYLQTIFVSENIRLKGVGKQVLYYLENYAKNNGNDLIFGHINNKAQFTKDDRETFFSDVDMIRYWLHDNGYGINEDNNDFHKLIIPNEKIRFAKGGITESYVPDYLRMFLSK